MNANLIITAREQSLTAAWEAYLADIPMTWLIAARVERDLASGEWEAA